MPYDPKRMSHFWTIRLNKNDNKKRNSRSVPILFSVIESSLTYFSVFVVLYLEIVENIDQMHKNTFPS